MELYREIILDHYHNPHNKGTIEHPDYSGAASNVSCGDTITLQLALDANERVEDVAFEGEGCAISQASASLATDAMCGKTLEEIQAMNKDDIFELLGGEINPGRINCALLILKARDSAMQVQNSK